MPQPTFNLTRPSLLRCFGGALALVIGLTGASLANASSAKPSAPAAVASMDLSGLKSSHGYTPALGESLERIVAKTMPESPLSVQVLSQAFVLLNPQAFGSAKPQRTQSTATLKVPNHNQLMQLVLARNPAEAATGRAPEPVAVKAAAAPRPAEKRENWVRYAGGPIKTPYSFDGSAPDRSGWVQYPNLARAAAPAAQPESKLDTSGWVRFVANRLYPQQQFAQLFD